MMEYLMLHVKKIDSSWVLSSSIFKNCSILFLRLLFNYIIFPSLSFLQLFPCTFFLSSKFMISFLHKLLALHFYVSYVSIL